LFQKIGRELLLQDGSVEDMPPKAAIIKTNQAYLATNYHEHLPTSSADYNVDAGWDNGTGTWTGQVLVYNKEQLASTFAGGH
jgi:hypothetical protein